MFKYLASLMLWPEESEWVGVRVEWNPSGEIPIKKRINTELFIHKMAALYSVDGQNKRWAQSGGGQPLKQVDMRIKYVVCYKCQKMWAWKTRDDPVLEWV